MNANTGNRDWRRISAVLAVCLPLAAFAGVEADGGLVPIPRTGEASTNEAAAVAPRFVTYRQACIEGWAAKPTNDVQRTVWKAVLDERRRGPTNPIRILPGQKPRRKS